MSNLSGNGPQYKYRLYFDGDESGYELWETKFLAHLRIKDLHGVIEAAAPDAAKNISVYAELVLLLDNVSLSLVMRDAKDDGKKAIEILRDHYLGKSKPRIISLYSELASLKMSSEESVTDYVLRAECTAAALKNAQQNIDDALLIAMLLKGLPTSYNSFATVITQRDGAIDFVKFKSALRSFEEAEKSRSQSKDESDNIMGVGYSSNNNNNGSYNNRSKRCHICQKPGHLKYNCPQKNKSRNNRWCQICKNSSHYTDQCHRSRRGEVQSAKVNLSREDGDHASGAGGHSFAFKLDLLDEKDLGNADKDFLNECLIVDSGATSHLCFDESKFISFDQNFKPETHYIELADGTRCNNVVEGRGDCNVQLRDNKGVCHDILLKNVLYVPSYGQNIFSVQSATDMGASVHFDRTNAHMRAPDGTIFDFDRRGKLYFLNNIKASTVITKSLEEWHNIFAHSNVNDIVKTENCVKGMHISDKSSVRNFQCDECILGKMCQTVERTPDVRASNVLELVHTDLAGPITPTAREGFKYAITFTDDYSSAVTVYFLKQKSDAPRALEKFIADCSPYGKIKRLRSDSGGEFIGKDFKDIAIQNGIKQEFSCPETPAQNGGAERQWRTIFNLARCIMSKMNVPKFLWTYALRYSVHVRNRIYNPRTGKTPVEMLTKVVPNINKLEIFGCNCFAYVQNKKKLDDRAKEGIFVGFDTASPSYLVYFPNERTVRKIRCVVFNQKTKMQNMSPIVEEYPCDYPVKKAPSNSNNIENQGGSFENINDESLYEDSIADDPDIAASGIQARGELSLSAATVNGGRVEASISGSRVEASPSRRNPVRNRQLPKHMSDYVVGDDNNDSFDAAISYSVDYCYKMSFIPNNYRDAINSENSKEWCEAMDQEINVLSDNDTYELTSLPDGRKCIDGRWVYNVKPGIENKPKFRARYCAKGFAQKYDVDYDETFAPTCRMDSLRTVVQFAAQNNMCIHTVDASSAFLHADVDRDLYVRQPEGYVQFDKYGNELVMKLRKSLYGLKQSSRNWNKCLDDFLISKNFKRSLSDPCLYTKYSQSCFTLILVHVDDMIIAGSNERDVTDVKNTLSNRFKIKDLGILKWYLGIEFIFGDDYIALSQENFIAKVLDKFNMQDAKTKSLPCDVGLTKFDCLESKQLESPTLYRAIIGSLTYIQISSRPDICFIVTKLAQYMDKPTKAHLGYAKDVLRYLKGTINHALVYRKTKGSLSLLGFCDSDYAGSDDRKSTSGYCYKLCPESALVSWKTKKQSVVALSSTEAEYISMAHGMQHGKFLRQLFADISNSQASQFDLYVDNQGAIKLAQNPVHHQRSKHIDVKFHFLRSEIQFGTAKIHYVQSAHNIADMFTKALSRVKFDNFNYSG